MSASDGRFSSTTTMPAVMCTVSLNRHRTLTLPLPKGEGFRSRALSRNRPGQRRLTRAWASPASAARRCISSIVKRARAAVSRIVTDDLRAGERAPQAGQQPTPEPPPHIVDQHEVPRRTGP